MKTLVARLTILLVVSGICFVGFKFGVHIILFRWWNLLEKQTQTAITNLLFSILTGCISSWLVVKHYDRIERRRHKMSHDHIVSRYIDELVRVLTAVRVAAKLPAPTGREQLVVARELEEILGNDKEISVMRLFPHLNALSAEEHRVLARSLSAVQSSLEEIFALAVAHKTMEEYIVVSIAEMQRWVDDVLRMYASVPEVFDEDNQVDDSMRIPLTVIATSLLNLTMNCFGIIFKACKFKESNESDLRYGSRSI